MSVEYIYLLQDSAAVRSNQSVYKIGRTAQSNFKRFHGYPKGYVILLHTSCNDSVKCEKYLLDMFKTKYIHRTNFGDEYFEGDCDMMITDINQVVHDSKNNKFININELNIQVLNPDHKLYYDYYFLSSGNINTLKINNHIINKLNEVITPITLNMITNERYNYYEDDFKINIKGNIGHSNYIYKIIHTVCMNSRTSENYIFIHDRSKKIIFVKIENDKVAILDKDILLKLLYNLLKKLYEHENLNQHLKKIYKIYIEYFESNQFKIKDHEFIEIYINEIYISICKLEKTLVNKINNLKKGIKPKIIYPELHDIPREPY